MTDDRVPGTGLRRFAEGAFDRQTLERVVLPALADLQHECAEAQPVWHRRCLTSARAYWGLWKTIAWCLLGDAVRDRDGITASLGRRLVVYLPIFVVLLMLPSAWWMLGFASKHGARAAVTAGVFLTPASVLVALPAAFFFAIAMSRARADLPSTRLLPTVIAGLVTCAAVVFALLMIVVPTTNQSFRTVVYRQFQPEQNASRVPLRKGLPEMTWPELNDQIRHPPSSRQEEVTRAHRHVRFAFAASVFVLGLLGLGIADRWQSRWATFGAALAVFVLFAVSFGVGARLNSGGSPSIYGTWTANGAFAILGLRLLRTRKDWKAVAAAALAE